MFFPHLGSTDSNSKHETQIKEYISNSRIHTSDGCEGSGRWTGLREM